MSNPRPPRRGARDAPAFDGTDAKDLERFFDDLEFIATESVLDDAAKIRYAKYYATGKASQIWGALDELKDGAQDWAAAKQAIKNMYPELADGQMYTYTDLEQLIDAWKQKGFGSRKDFAEYRGDFIVHYKYLLSHKLISEEEAKRLFIRPITGQLRDRLRARLEAKEQDPAAGQSYAIEIVSKHMDHVLGGSSFDAPQSSTAVKKEDAEYATLKDSIRSLQLQVETMTKQKSAPQRSTGCLFCGETGHFIRSCSSVVDYIRVKKCERATSDGRITLPDGSPIPTTAVGKTLKEKIDYYWTQRGQGSVNIVDYPTADDEPSAAIIASVDESPTKELENEVARLQVLVNDAKRKLEAKKARFDGVVIPQKGTRMGSGSSQNGKPAGKSSSQSAAQPQQRRDDKPPQYRYQAPIEDPAIEEAVLSRFLSTNFSISGKEYLAICAGARRSLKEQIISKRFVVGDTNLIECPESDGTGGDSDGFEPLAEATVCFNSSTFAARDSLPLRTLECVIEDSVKVEALLDQGAVVCIIREDVWRRTRVQLDPDQAMTLESADANKSLTLGMIRDAKFTIAGIDVVLQVQVVSKAPFEALLGRPFFAVTECETKDFRDGNQLVTLTDPIDRSKRSKICTGIRMFNRPDEQGFDQSRN